MDNKCPKCQKKLSIFYVKPNCPYCGCDILNYHMEQDLDEDNRKAEEEFAKLDKLLNKLMFWKKNKDN